MYYIKVHNKSWEKHVFALKMNVGSQTDNLITPPTLIFIRTISISWTFATGFTGLSQKFIKAERILFIFFELHRTAARTWCSTAISPAEFLIGYESVKQNSLNWELKGRHKQSSHPLSPPHICSGYRYLRLVKTYENLPLLFVCLIVLLSRSLIVFCFVLSFTLIRYPIQLPELRKKSQLKNNRFLLRSFLHVSPPHPPHHCSLLMDEVSTFLHRTGLELLFSGGLLRGN